MMEDADGYFPERVAATYDDSSETYGPGAADAVAEVLAGLAGAGRALELGIGTGRIALPLARRGVPVHEVRVPDSPARAASTSRSGRNPRTDHV
jgi:hypothetical protein